ncbi:MAG: putative transposase [Candidatus Omnitrophota bacterium]|jgi:putative transposase
MNIIKSEKPPSIESSVSVLDSILKEGARRLLKRAIQVEASSYIASTSHELDEHGHRLVVRKGHLPERTISTGVGAIPVKQPRVRDQRKGQHFSSKILPKYMRRAPSIDALVPALYLHGFQPETSERRSKLFLAPRLRAFLRPISFV